MPRRARERKEMTQRRPPHRSGQALATYVRFAPKAAAAPNVVVALPTLAVYDAIASLQHGLRASVI